MSTQPGRDHTSSSTPALDGKGGTDLAVKVTGYSYGAPFPENSTLASVA